MGATHAVPAAPSRGEDRPAPPGPRLPRFAQGMRMLLSEADLLERCRRRYGDVFALDVWPFETLVVVADPQELKRIFTGSPATYHAGEGNAILEPLVGPESVLLKDEEEHLRRRKLLLPAFHGERMRAWEPVVREIARAEAATWPRGEAFPLHPAMQRITLRVIVRVVFGIEDAARMERLEHLLGQVLEHGHLPLMVPLLQREWGGRGPWARARRVSEEVDALLRAEIAARRGEDDLSGRHDVLSALVEAGLGDDEVKDELMTLLIAGHETTATGLAWAFERTLRHPEVLARARSGEDAYLDALVRETLRVRPVLSYVMRRLTADTDVGGYRAPAGATVGTSIRLLHGREDLFPAAKSFRPERFLEETPDTYTWVPFGGGVRRCLGASFAQWEMRLVLAEVLPRPLRPDRPADERARRRAITFVPHRGARVVQDPGPSAAGAG